MTVLAKRERKSRRSLGYIGLYLFTGLVVLTIALGADWPQIQRSFFKWDIIRDMFPEVLTIGARNTLLYTALAFGFGLFLALVLALMRRSEFAPYRIAALVYIELFRSIPALVTIILVGFGLPLAFGWSIPFGTAGKGMIGLGIVAAAYMAETIRAGIEAVPRGQMEAARSLGMSYGRAMVTVVIPQALRIVIPPLTNEFVLLLKDTSLLSVLGVTASNKELLKFARDDAVATFNSTPYVVAGLVYLAITVPLTFLARRLESGGANRSSSAGPGRLRVLFRSLDPRGGSSDA